MASKTYSHHPQAPPRTGKKPLSLLAQFDDLVRNANALSVGEEEGKRLKCFDLNYFFQVPMRNGVPKSTEYYHELL